MLPRWSNCNIRKKKFAKIIFARKSKFCFTSCLLVLRDVSSRAEIVMQSRKTCDMLEFVLLWVFAIFSPLTSPSPGIVSVKTDMLS